MTKIRILREDIPGVPRGTIVDLHPTRAVIQVPAPLAVPQPHYNWYLGTDEFEYVEGDSSHGSRKQNQYILRRFKARSTKRAKKWSGRRIR